MTRLIGAVVLSIALALTACEGGAPASTPPSSSSPSLGATTDNYPPYRSLDDAVEHTVGKTHPDLLILAEPMTAQQAADRTGALGLGFFPAIKTGQWDCPPYAHCPYPGELPDSRGWLIISRDPAAANTGTVLVHVFWRSDLAQTSTQANFDLSRRPLNEL